jgi:hypothetical protein
LRRKVQLLSETETKGKEQARRRTMVEQNFREVSSRAAEACSMTLEKGREALGLTSDVNRDIAGRSVELSAAIAQEGAQYLGEVGAALRQASEGARELWTRQWNLVQEFSRDPMGSPQEAVALSWQGGEKITRLGDAQREAVSRFAGNVQDLLGQASRETHETVTKYAGKILALYGLKN